MFLTTSVVLFLGLIYFKPLSDPVVCGRLKAHATVWGVPFVSSDGRFQILCYRHPQLKNIPEAFGFGQGFVQLQEVASGRVLAEKRVQDLDAVNWCRWASNQVEVANVAMWKLP